MKSLAKSARLVLLLGITCSPCLIQDVAASPSAASKNSKPGYPEAGRTLFNGKGVCHYCHGIDGDRNRLPQLEPDTASVIAQLNPPPPDLRNRRALRLKTDRQRARIIREGHEGTGMFPDTMLSDQEIADTVAYLAVLRNEAGATGR
ncbi:MAG TPA: cytochrome c [Nitrospira sp.]|nr:cytochrome c [Nitrospira sp.]